ncbi:hypothetical protein QCE62_21115 [Caballeronia sp. LZ033]|uniref:hypothetical protein n=1 Tax=Caballeronia sp. LZ033 TaxID=3038566 RepID=UPI002859CEAF|nr:hypothetical protein [Caballeronia sp. LZ033]MDR5816095.1 hypothetical protein [Caballeronia sp. LZ033]
MNPTINRYFTVWALFIPISSVLVIPSIQGTVPGFLFSFLSPLVVMLAGANLRARYITTLAMAFLLWLFFFSGSQLADMMVDYTIRFKGVVLVNPLDRSFVLRNSLFTQSLYLMVIVLFGVFVSLFYDRSWDKPFIAGGVVMALFGLYEFVYFLIFGVSGDVISNRGFGSDLGTNDVMSIAFQTVDLAGHTFARIKSLTGEPSMYVFSIFPYWVYARTVSRSPWPARIIGLSLVLTVSTTALVGLLCFAAVKASRMRIDVLRVLLSLLILVLLCYVFRNYIGDFFEHGIIDKVNGRNDSGAERFGNFMASIEFWASLPLANQIVGVGFGYIRSTDMASTLLVNNGILGVALFSWLFLYPAFRLDSSERSQALRISLIAVFVMMMMSVPEFAYLAPWAFVGMAYHRLREYRIAGTSFDKSPPQAAPPVVARHAGQGSRS